MTDNLQYDFNSEFENRNYKSCFARSMAVNSQYKPPKSLDYQQMGSEVKKKSEIFKKEISDRPSVQNQETQEVKMRKSSRTKLEEARRYSCSNLNTSLYNSIRRSSFCSSRISEIPVENMVNQSKLETLQWQLKEIQKSREMYRAVMKQVVTYLEKAHHSLELLGSRINRRNSVHRSRSEHQMEVSRISDNSTLLTGVHNQSKTIDEHKLKDLQWKQSKPEEPSPDEIPPDKLAQEAFRLLRTAQSLLNTREPDLVQISTCEPSNDIEFLEQLAKEFPPPEIKAQRATSFSLSPKLIMPEVETKISTAFNRKLSLQLSDVRRTTRTVRNVDSARGSVADSDTELGNDGGIFSNQKSKSEKSNSPANGSISSVEDESGFSSMNSFQEVGLPIVNSTMTDEVSTKNALLRSMLHNSSNYSSLNFSLNQQDSLTETITTENPIKEERTKTSIDDIRLWQKPAVPKSPSSSSPIGYTTPTSTPQHKRWGSSPVKDTETQSLKVLWV
ncbi:uncharacterized protein [Diabrotica undecimpunctata]|uniref:uncharacterized protein isoform X1 n=2 Tax=Diabrotica undecimpunctata TaxID=50387 RepID=UPI003B63EE33